MIKSVIVHLTSELPIMVDLYEAPSPNATSVRCTNVRTVDGKRPSFIHDPRATFLLPWHLIRLMEVPSDAVPVQEQDSQVVVSDPHGVVGHDPGPLEEPEPELLDEEPDEDLLARIRSI
ncbi:MAG TPA: hypothetical protein VM284_00600 [Candidatus Limnocylindria bacterium]|nr:hypothetical protein [Candidatus Limnocylindria bacterium]